MVPSEIVLLDLFSGLGGFSLGLQQAGFKIKKHYYSEVDTFAIANYSYHFKKAIYAGPIENITKGKIKNPDIICFGSPCQDLSTAGKQQGLKGSKSKLFFEAVRILDLYRPRMFIFENVKGLFSSNGGKDFEIVLRSFANLGIYELQWQLLNTSWFLPQNRERIYVVGSLRGQPRPEIFPLPKNDQTFAQGIKKTISQAYIAPTIDTKVGDSGTYAPYIFTTRKRDNAQQIEFRKDKNVNCITGSKKCNYLAEQWIPTKFVRTEKAKKIRKQHQKKGVDYHPFQEKELVLRDDNKFGALTSGGSVDHLLTNMKSIRRLTPLECERLQGFPDYWTQPRILDGKQIELSNSRRYQLIGNAVSVPVVKAIGEKILESNMFHTKTEKRSKMMISPLDGLGKLSKTPITYYGGKQSMTKHILSLIPPHNLYCEPFVGGAAIFFAKEPSAVEVINDLNGDVVNFYQVCKLQFTKLQKLIEATPHSRKLHTKAAAVLKTNQQKDKVKRAWAFWVQTNMSFSARIFGGYAYERKSNGTSKRILNKKQAFTRELCERLDLVDIECNDALKVIKSRDTSDSFFYIDPPYFNSDMGHYKGYTEQDFTELLQVLSALKGKFLLSSYPSDVLQTFTKKNGWSQHTTEKAIAITSKTNKKKTEVLTANYNITKMKNDLSGLPEMKMLRMQSQGLKLQLTFSKV